MVIEKKKRQKQQAIWMTEKTTRDGSKSTREDQRKSTAIQIDETSVKPTEIPKDI